MKTASVATAKAHLSALLADVAAGEEVVITRRGQPVARLVSPQTGVKAFDWSALRAWVESEPTNLGATVVELRERDLL
ncbi:MAG TPA: type II toxin-antitoxin system prevent-host-death family antitoxin [Lamprocystis sp. (in: g-proteobacteria)]|nr:type II toxin-antitoxin system prevent-host-death family antitoxin [Lamprocystis sp. (in: g-proteobacteria)]